MTKKKKIVLTVALGVLVALVTFVIVTLIQDVEFKFISLNFLKQALPQNPEVLQEYNYYLKQVISFFINIFLLLGMTGCAIYYFIKKILKNK